MLAVVHSLLSKRDNFAGARIGFYAGDAQLVHYLREVRKHAGLLPPGPVQAAAVVALGDDAQVEAQRGSLPGAGWTRLHRDPGGALGYPAHLPDGAFYLWVQAPNGGRAWAAATDLAKRAGIVVSPGDFYGPDGDRSLPASQAGATRTNVSTLASPGASGSETAPTRASTRPLLGIRGHRPDWRIWAP